MYKRFLRWASDRLADDGIIGFVSNSGFLDGHQDDGFRKVIAEEFNELWAVDLKGNARTSGERRRQEGGNIFDDKIRVGVAVYFLVRRKGLGGFKVFYNVVQPYLKAPDKVDYIKNKTLTNFAFTEIVPDPGGQWLNQSDGAFAQLLPLANRETKLAKTYEEERAVFGLYSVGISTNRDEWVYDFDADSVSDKVLFFCRTYRNEISRFEDEQPDVDAIGGWVNRSIKWTTELERHLVKGDNISFSEQNVVSGLYRPFVAKLCYYAPIITHRRYQMPQLFPHDIAGENEVICFPGNATSNGFQVLATDRVFSHDLLKTTQCLPLYRYTPDGQRTSNITQWGLQRINDHYRQQWGDHFDAAYPDGITAEDIFAYTYAVLHDPVYRHDYRVDLLREFPRLPLYHDFDAWAKMGQELLDLHIGFESADPYPLQRQDRKPASSRPTSSARPEPVEGRPPKPILRADKERNLIVLDDQTTLAGIPEAAWRYQLGSRSALEWVLDQYKEKKPRDPTIRERFNTYRFADYKEPVIDLLQRVCTVSVKTMAIVDDMAYWEDGHLVVFDDRDKNEWETAALSEWFGEPGGPDDDPEYQAWLTSLPDIRDTR